MIPQLWKIVWQFLINLNAYLTYDPVILLWGIWPQIYENICPYQILYLDTHSIFLYDSPKPETTQMSIEWWIDKLVVIYQKNGILVSLKNE